MIKEFEIKTNDKYELIDITEKIKKIVSGVKEGICLVYVPHATSSIIINENYDPNICRDIINFLKEVILEGKWLHDKIDGNAAAHIKSAILGPSESIPIKDGKLLLGTWQAIMIADWDGPKKRRIIVQVIECM